MQPGDAVFFAAGKADVAGKFAGAVRTRLGQELGLIEQGAFRFCWITDFPMYEVDEETKQIDFSHNPFSMPQGELEALNSQDPLTIKAYQYDIVCNGIELSSGAIRNHRPDIMIRAFEIAGYTEADVEARFGGMLNAFRYGAPPHGGSAPGIDRIVMLLADEKNIREVILFPLNQQGEDLMMGAPAEVTPARLKELSLRIDLPPKAKVGVKAGRTLISVAVGGAGAHSGHRKLGHPVFTFTRVHRRPSVDLLLGGRVGTRCRSSFALAASGSSSTLMKAAHAKPPHAHVESTGE